MKKLLLILTIFCSTLTMAKNTGHIFTGSTSSSLMLSPRTYQTGYDLDFVSYIGYGYAFTNGFQVNSSFSASIGSGMDAYALSIGPSYNFNGDEIENSFYIGLQAGALVSSYSYSTYTDGVVYLDFGKRFKLSENVSYSPSVSAVQVLGPGDNDPNFSVDLFKFSILF